MPRFIDAVSILRESRPGAAIWQDLRTVFEQRGLTFEADTPVIFSDFDGEEREPEVMDAESDAIGHLVEWPGLGGTRFLLGNHSVAVFVHGTTPGHGDVVTLSVNAGPYMSDVELRRSYDALVAQVHDRLKAMRTIVDHELLSPGSSWKAVLARTRDNVFQGAYSLDLRSDNSRSP